MTERRYGKRRRWPATLLTLLAVLAAGALWFRWQQTGLCPEELTVSDPRLPAGFEGFRVTVISDVHCAIFGRDNEKLLTAVAKQRPDLIAVTGDLIDCYRPDYSMAEPLCRGLAAIAPTYYVTGNHEWALGTDTVKRLKQTIAACGVTVLSNESLALERNGDALILAGIDDSNGYADQKSLPELMQEIRAQYGDPFVLLLSHRNNRYRLYAQCQVDVTLCGHAHGGLIRLPFTDGLVDSERNIFPTRTAGVYPLDYGQLVVSRGLGNSGSTFRLFNRPHLPVVVFTRGA